MQNNLDRAKQFLPFDALKGFRKALEKKKKFMKIKRIYLMITSTI